MHCFPPESDSAIGAIVWPDFALAICFHLKLYEICFDSPSLAQLHHVDNLISCAFGPTGIFEHAVQDFQF